MNKRGQIFLIAAIIFVMSIYSVAIEYNTIKTYPTPEDYKDLSENYQTEYPKIINFALYNGTNPVEAIDNFTIAFLEEAKKKDPNFGVFYIYKDSTGNLHIVNTLNNKVLKLEFTNVKGEQVSLALMSQSTQTKGDLCIEGIGCNTVDTIVCNFDSAYYKTNVTSPTELRISEVGSAAPPIPIQIKDFTSMNYLTSEKTVTAGLGPGNIVVTIKQY